MKTAEQSSHAFDEDREKAFQEFRHERGHSANGESFSRGWHAALESIKLPLTDHLVAENRRLFDGLVEAKNIIHILKCGPVCHQYCKDAERALRPLAEQVIP